MSSTNRGAARRLADYYPTPVWCTHRLLEAVTLPFSVRLCEPCVGDGAIVRAVDQVQARNWWCNDLRDVSDTFDAGGAWVQALDQGDAGNWLRCQHAAINQPQPWHADALWVLTNPPFCVSDIIVRQSLQVAEVTIMLLSLNWIGGQERSGWLRGIEPDSLLCIPDRVSFDGGGQDSVYYAWMVWGTHECIPRGIRLLNSTPASVRAAEKERARRYLAGIELPPEPEQAELWPSSAGTIPLSLRGGG